MFRIRKKIRFEMAHRLRRAFSKQCKNLHGHSYIAEVILEAEKLNEDGMIIDFGELKALLKNIIEELDHSIILNEEDELCDVMSEAAGKFIAVSYNPTAEMMARDIAFSIESILPSNILTVTVRLHETESGWAEFEMARTQKANQIQKEEAAE